MIKHPGHAVTHRPFAINEASGYVPGTNAVVMGWQLWKANLWRPKKASSLKAFPPRSQFRLQSPDS
jgi:hypothetical protein